MFSAFSFFTSLAGKDAATEFSSFQDFMILQRESQSESRNKLLLRPENAGQLSGVVDDGMTYGQKLKCLAEFWSSTRDRSSVRAPQHRPAKKIHKRHQQTPTSLLNSDLYI